MRLKKPSNLTRQTFSVRGMLREPAAGAKALRPTAKTEESQEVIRTAIQFVIRKCRELIELESSPHAIAGGAAVGIFMGFSPLFGLKLLLSMGVAALLRVNPLAAVIAVSLHDIVTPLWPILLRLEYDLGYWALSHPHHLPLQLEAHHLHWDAFFRWETVRVIGVPLFIGSLVIAIPAAAITYFLVRSAVVGARRKGAAAQSGKS